MVTKQLTIALIVVLVIAGLILCLALAVLCSIASCGQAVLLIALLLLTYSVLYKSSPQIPIIARAMTGPRPKPPRLA